MSKNEMRRISSQKGVDVDELVYELTDLVRNPCKYCQFMINLDKCSRCAFYENKESENEILRGIDEDNLNAFIELVVDEE